MDANTRINSIIYNYMNMPISIVKSDRVEYPSSRASYFLKRVGIIQLNNSSLTKSTDFIGNFVYENRVPVYNIYDEGRIVYNTDGTYFGEAFIKDHLGNVRVACRLDRGVLKNRQVDSYYPFGMNIKGLTANSTDLTAQMSTFTTVK